jgi:putative ABC transport system substrate-binding protein
MNRSRSMTAISLALAVFIVLGGIALTISAATGKKIAILMFSREARYESAAMAFEERMRVKGFGEPGTAMVVEDAGANKVRAAELVQKLVRDKPDLIFSLGTSMTVPIAREIRDVPIVFSIVYDPIEAGIAERWENSGNNTTGTAMLIPMAKLMDLLNDFMTATKVAVLYTPGEKNSESQLRDLQETQQSHHIKIVPVPVSGREDVARLLPLVLRTSDAVFITGSNVIDRELPKIVEATTRAGVATITHLADLVERGVLLGLSTDPRQHGQLAADKAIKILRGAKPSSIPIETLNTYNVLLNMKTANAAKITIRPEFKRKVTKIFE